MATSIPASQRAGTPLTEDQSKRVNVFFWDGRKGNTQHGTIDLEHRFYQIGGQFSDFHFRKKNWITMPFEVWTQLTRYEAYLDWLEWYDREGNVAYLVGYQDAAQHGQEYNAGIGSRWGVPYPLFGVQRDRG